MSLFRRRGEEGVTLNELLIAMVITGIILIPLVAIMFTTVHTLVGTESRIDQSNGGALFSSDFDLDVQNAVTVATGPGTTEATAVCGAGARAVDLLLTTTASSDATQSTISYYHGTGATATVLYRRTCTAGQAPSQAGRVLHNLLGAPAFTCLDASENPVDCSAWQQLTATVTQSSPLTSGSDYTTKLQATKRVTG